MEEKKKNTKLEYKGNRGGLMIDRQTEGLTETKHLSAFSSRNFKIRKSFFLYAELFYAHLAKVL